MEIMVATNIQNTLVNKSRFSEIFKTDFTHWLAIALLFSIPISTTFTSILIILYLIFLCFSKKIKTIVYYIANPISISILIFISITIIGLSYTLAPTQDILKAIKTSSRLALIPLLMPVFQYTKWRNRGLWALLIAILLSAIAGYIKFNHAGSFHDSFFKDRIYTSSFIAFGMFFVATLAFEKRIFSNKIYLISLISFIALGGYYLFFINSGRTGQFLLFILSTALIYKKTSKKFIKTFSIILFFLTVSFASLYYFSSDHLIQSRINARIWLVNHNIPIPQLYFRFADAFRESRSYILNWQQKPEIPPMAEDSSMRLEFYFRSLKIALQKPILGWGSGSFTMVYNSIFPERQNDGKKVTNPHNQYLLTYIELGIPGLFALLFVLFSIAKHAISLRSNFESTILLGLVLFMAAGCLFNSWFLDFTSFYFFACVTSLIASATIYREPN